MKRLLLVVDYQNDFVGGTLGFEKAKTLESGITTKIEEFISNDDLVIFTMDTHGEEYLSTQEGKNLPVPHCLYGTLGWELYGKVGEIFEANKELGNIEYITKETFGSDILMHLLTCSYEGGGYYNFMNKYAFDEVNEIHLCGVVTNMCVISNAIIAKSALPEARIVIHADLCASFNDELHEQALNVMESMQMDIVGR